MRYASLGAVVVVVLLLAAGSGAQKAHAGAPCPGPVGGIASLGSGPNCTDNNNSALYFQTLGVLPANSVSIYIYAVTGPGPVAITVTDAVLVADYYELWMSSNPGFTGPTTTLVGTTPPVETGSPLVAPFYNPQWDGLAPPTAFSSATFTVNLPSGTTYFAVRDAVQDSMAATLDGPCGRTETTLVLLGCTETSPHPITVLPDFVDCSFTISFAPPSASSVPEFNSPTFVVAALALPLLFLLQKRYSVWPRHPV